MDLKSPAFIDDTAVNRAVDHDTGARFDGQAAEKIAAHMQRAVPLHDGVAGDGAVDLG
jgi:hypothetical protein